MRGSPIEFTTSPKQARDSENNNGSSKRQWSACSGSLMVHIDRTISVPLEIIIRCILVLHVDIEEKAERQSKV
jgi:hypothetical protein